MLLDRRTWFVKERVAVLKLTNTWDLIDPETGVKVGIARDEPSSVAKFARLLVNKQFLPTTINVYESESLPPVLSLAKKPGLLRSSVVVTDPSHAELGKFTSKAFSLGGGFFVFDTSGRQVAEVKGDWKGWNFRLLDGEGLELGIVTKKWAGIGKELFTTADSYVISLSEHMARRRDVAPLLLAAGLAIDIVFKSK